MRMLLRTKLLVYKLLSITIGKALLEILSFGICVNLGRKNKAETKPFLVAITVDTESGYVDKDERRIWQKENPNAFVGYYYGIKNLLSVFNKYGIKATFLLSTQCFSSRGRDRALIIGQLNNAIKKGHEIGLHLHPDSDFSIQKKLSKKFKATSAFFYDYETKFKIIKAAKELIEENLDKGIAKGLISFRWGNWALDSDGAKALHKLGFKIDSSAVPGIKGHSNDTMRYDWSKVRRHYPWKLSINSYQLTSEIINNKSSILEIPIATFSFFGFKLRADPINLILLNKAFVKYYNKADRSKKPFVFVVMTHSSEATMKDGRETNALKDLENFIIFSKKYKDVKFVTLKEAYKQLSP